MDVDPSKRYRSGQDFADALNEALKEDNFWSSKTIADTLVVQNNANVIVHTLIPENPCSQCGRENRPTSRFCRHCGHSLDETSPLVTDAYQVGYVSNEGKHAPENEDMLLVVQGLCVNLAPPRPFGLFAVADGLRGPEGKAAGGHEASRLAIETLTDVLLPQLTTIAQATIPGSPASLRPAKSPQPPSQQEKILAQWMRDSVQQANRVIYHCNADYDTSMASTLTVALLHKHRLYVASIGDSRAYLYSARQKRLACLTRDHTLAANLVEAELLKPDEIRSSAKRNQHYRYLGLNYQIPIDLYQCEVTDGDEILLCTDGLWHMVPDERLTVLLGQSGDIQHIAQSLVNAANDAGGEGNVSVIVVRTE
jgi:serine/threonine protein phosphatase PrpC